MLQRLIELWGQLFSIYLKCPNTALGINLLIIHREKKSRENLKVVKTTELQIWSRFLPGWLRALHCGRWGTGRLRWRQWPPGLCSVEDKWDFEAKHVAPTGTWGGRPAGWLTHRQVWGRSLQIPHALVQRTLGKKRREAGVSDDRNAGGHNWRF